MSYLLIKTALLLFGLANVIGAFNDTNSTDENEGSENQGGTIDITNLPIEMVCQIVGIPKENCSCLNYPFFCPTKEDKHVFKCDRYHDIIEGIVKVSASGLGLIGNSIVLFITYKTWKGITRFKQLIALLALADFIFAAFEMANAIPLFWTCEWVYSLFWCKFFKGTLNLGGIFALGLITVIALERYLAIAKIFTGNKKRIPFWFWILLTGILSVASVIPMIVVLDIDEDNLCVEVWDKHPNGSLIYSWYLLIATFLLPMAIIIYFYHGVIKSILSNTKTAAIQNSDSMLKQRNKTNKRIMIILFAVAFAFFILVLPNRVIWVVLDTIEISSLSLQTYRILKYVGVFPYLFHVSINPIIYSFVDKKFQSQVIRFFRSKTLTFGKRSRAISSPTTTVTNIFSNVLRKLSRTDDCEMKTESPSPIP